jgi:hypothetical protein
LARDLPDDSYDMSFRCGQRTDAISGVGRDLRPAEKIERPAPAAGRDLDAERLGLFVTRLWTKMTCGWIAAMMNTSGANIFAAVEPLTVASHNEKSGEERTLTTSAQMPRLAPKLAAQAALARIVRWPLGCAPLD